MGPVSDAELYALAIDALDPPQARLLREQLTRSPALRARLEAVRALLAAPTFAAPTRPAPPDEGWRVPHMRWPELGVSLTPAMVMGDEARRLRVRLRAPEPPPERWLVVLTRAHEGGWRCAFPEEEEDWVRVSELPEEGDERLFELSVSADEADAEWAVLLPEDDLTVDWGAPPAQRWAPLVRRVLAREVPLQRVTPERVEATGEEEATGEPPGED